MPFAIDLPSALGVLSAMITPALLISACGTLILATSHRLGRTTDRARLVAEQFESLARSKPGEKLMQDELSLLYHQVQLATRRARLLQRVMTHLSLALAVFVATSVSIGVVAAFGFTHAWIVLVPIGLGLIGAGLLLDSSILLIIEARLTMEAINDEMLFLRRIAEHHASPEILRPWH